MTVKNQDVKPRYLPTVVIAALYGFQPAYLRKLRMMKSGPPYRKGNSKVIVYPVDEFEEWFERTFRSVQPDRDLP